MEGNAGKRVAEGFLFTDYYQLTMAQLYFNEGLHETPAQFDYFFRSAPEYGGSEGTGALKAGYCVFAGLGDLLARLSSVRPTRADVDALAALTTSMGARKFSPRFLDWLASGAAFEGLSVRSVAEGRVVHPGAPLLVVTGPLAAAQLLETALLNTLNYPTLVATKAARLRRAAPGAAIADFGMRRGQGLGVNAGTRAALIGGVNATSNTGAGLALGAPLSGTHAHSMVQAFMAAGGSELDAFRAYARLYPDDCVLLIDTVDTLTSGIGNAITVFTELRAKGHEPLGVRLDSGDLAHLAVECAGRLNAAGLERVKIVLSSQLDELTIWQIVSQVTSEAKARGMDADALVGRLQYGVGTRLMVSAGAPALDGVFKLVALKEGGEWRPAIKVSDSPAKTLSPGEKALYRVYDERGMATADLVTLAHERPKAQDALTLHHPAAEGVSRALPAGSVSRLEPLLEEVWAGGATRLQPPEGVPVSELSARREADEALLDAGVKRLVNPHTYHVSLSGELLRLKRSLISAARKGEAPAGAPAEAPAEARGGGP